MRDTSEPRHLDLVDRLRGEYHLPVNDGAGPLNGSMTFSRKFETPPIQHEAAAEITRLRSALEFIAAQGGKTLIAPSMGEDFDKGHQLGANKAFEQMADVARDAIRSTTKNADP